MIQQMIVTGLAVCGMMLAADLRAEDNPAAVAVPRETTGANRWVANHYGRMMALADQSPEKFKVVFIGDSITKKWLDQSGSLWADNFGDVDGPYYALNLGVPGDRTDHVLHRLKSKAGGGTYLTGTSTQNQPRRSPSPKPVA